MESTAATPGTPDPDPNIKLSEKNTLTPPTSEDADKHGNSDSELSDLELDKDDGGEIFPDHFYEGGKIPVFKPVSPIPIRAQFTSSHTLLVRSLGLLIPWLTCALFPEDNGPVSKLQQVHPQD